jgi:hypothetical protein
MFINKIKNKRIDGILRKSSILDSCWNKCSNIGNYVEELLLWKDPFFRTDYAKEVENITKIITNANGFGDFSDFLSKNPNRAKEVMQHIYTIDKSLFTKFKESFHIQNTSPTNHVERNRIYEEYWADIHKDCEAVIGTPRFWLLDFLSAVSR